MLNSEHVAPAAASGSLVADHLGGLFVLGSVGIVLRRRHGPSLHPSLRLSLDAPYLAWVLIKGSSCLDSCWPMLKGLSTFN